MASKTSLALLLPILALLFARFPCLASMLFFILLSVTLFLFKATKQTLKQPENDDAPPADDMTEKSSAGKNLFADKFDYSWSEGEWPNLHDNTPLESDGSISDENGLIEIAIPSAHSLMSTDGDDDLNKCSCKLYSSHNISLITEEDKLIEIDICMGSIKCSTFDI